MRWRVRGADAPMVHTVKTANAVAGQLPAAMA
jgi:hypothetical protein